MLKITATNKEATYSCTLDFAIMCGDKAIVASFYDRSLAKNLAAQFRNCENMGATAVRIVEDKQYYGGKFLKVKKEDRYDATLTSFMSNGATIGKGVVIHKSCGTDYVITDRNRLYKDLYNAFMNKFDCPIKEEWVEFIYSECKRRRFISSRCSIEYNGLNRNINVGDGSTLELENIMVVDLSDMTEEDYESIVLGELNRTRPAGGRKIGIADTLQTPIPHANLDEYMLSQRDGLHEQFKEIVKPLSEINGTVPEVALYNKKLKSQQGAMVNAATVLHKNRKNVFMIEGMGSGKTLQALSIFLKECVEKARNKNPKLSLKELYTNSLIKGRAVIMCPGQLCEKWKREAEEEIPNCHCKIIKTLADVTPLKKLYQNKVEPKGIEIYIFSKETAKLSYTIAPIPYKEKLIHIGETKNNVMKKNGTGHLTKTVCADCADAGCISNIFRDRNHNLENACRKCGSTRFKTITSKAVVQGAECPYCGSVLSNNTAYTRDNTNEEYEEGFGVLAPLRITDFMSHTKQNDYCINCGKSMWGPVTKHNKWQSISHFTTYTRTTRTSIYCLRGRSEEFLKEKLGNAKSSFPMDNTRISELSAVRKYPIATYIKKHLKGFFDMCILDEVHKYSSGDSGQGHAAHILAQSAKKSLALTGTISNGMASSMFYLFWYLEPALMQEHGFMYSDIKPFLDKYGATETTYGSECDYKVDESNEVYKKVVKGRQLSSPREKAGLSSMLYIDFLMGISVMLDLSDFADTMPPLNEIVRMVDVDYETDGAYKNGIATIKNRIHEKDSGGSKMMAALMRFGLFYLDKPYDRKPIMDATIPDYVVYAPPEVHEEDFLPLTNKEKAMIGDLQSIINDKKERAFVFCECTGAEEANILPRTKRIIMEQVGLTDSEVHIIHASVNLSEREEYMRSTAEKQNVKVFICNPALCDTGIDFIFIGDDGVKYNYNNILFFQLGTQLAVQWQASRRAYRLIQDLPCNVYYYAYEGTAQATACQLMGLKIASTAALQGEFSSSALAAQSNDIDARLMLAKALMKNEIIKTDEIKNLFTHDKAEITTSPYAGFVTAPDYWELTGQDRTESAKTAAKDEQISLFEEFEEFEEKKAEPEPAEEVKAEKTEKKEEDAWLEAEKRNATIDTKSKKKKTGKKSKTTASAISSDLSDKDFDDIFGF